MEYLNKALAKLTEDDYKTDNYVYGFYTYDETTKVKTALDLYKYLHDASDNTADKQNIFYDDLATKLKESPNDIIKILATSITKHYDITKYEPLSGDDGVSHDNLRILKDSLKEQQYDAYVKFKKNINTTISATEHRMNIYNESCKFCNELLSAPGIKEIFENYYIVNCNTEGIGRQYVIDDSNPLNPIENVVEKEIPKKPNTASTASATSTASAMLAASAKCKISVSNKHPVEYENAMYIMSGSNIISGGGAELGLTILEADVALATTYIINPAHNQFFSNLTDDDIVLIPRVYVYRNVKDFSILKNKHKLSIINILQMNKPKLDIGSDDTIFSPTITCDAFKQYYEKKINAAFRLAQYIGFQNIVIDDGGILDYHLPVHDSVTILCNAVVANSQYFESITIYTNNEDIEKLIILRL